MQAELQAHLRMKQVDVRTATHENKHVTKEKEMHLKRLKKRENALKILTGTLPGLEAQKETLMHELEQANALTHKQAEVSFDPLRSSFGTCFHSPYSRQESRDEG
jgi:argininosuccinate lyase